MQLKPITIYTNSDCFFCAMAKDFFRERNIPYAEIDVSTDEGGQMLKDLGFDVVPIIVINDQLIRGFNVQKLEKALADSKLFCDEHQK